MVRPLVFQIARIAVFSVAGLAPATGIGQQTIGNVGVQDATVSGNLELNNGRAVLVGSATLTAKDHTAEIALDRGGTVRVCATSGLHVSAGKSAAGEQTLMLALDRGAIEVKMSAFSSDFILTPDLRFAIQSRGPLDLRLRVTRNGDTCVENRGDNAPLLHIGDQFGETSYDLRAGQHVLFEHGSLKEVVDHESSPCGCPPEPVLSVADAGVTSASPAAVGSVVAVQQAEAQHPFPAAVSQGLAPAAPAPAAPAGAVHAEVATTLSYSAADTPAVGSPASTTAAGGARTTTGGSAASRPNTKGASSPGGKKAPVRAEAAPPPAAPSAPNLAHRIGHFFKRLFGRG